MSQIASFYLWSEETGRQAEDALFELQEIIDSLEEA